MPGEVTTMSAAPHLSPPRPDPAPAPGCDVCAALAKERATARQVGDHSRASDCNVELRHHPRRHPLSARNLFDAFPAACRTLRAARPEVPADLAERAVEEAVKFVAARARNPATAVSAPPLITEAWRILRRHRAAYGALCARFGTYVHGSPATDDPRRHTRARALIHATGFRPDPTLWRRST
ncbi:hypothetical protein ACWCQL_30535 [Streptomyces sp. NPDC002073]